jgi:CheY-like chemotaxis protein
VARFTAPKWADLAQAEGRPIRLTVEAEPDLWVRGWSDALLEALVNLVLNAVDALPTGGSIRLDARRSGDRVLIEVADSGIGMPPDVQARMFEPFFTTKGEHGTGLGLAMVFGIVERHGGQIAVTSREDAGTTFRLSLPVGEGARVRRGAPSHPTPACRLRILAVDDEPGLNQLLRAMLTRDGHDVRTTDSAEMAVAALEECDYDLVISDLSLGEGMNGWDLAAIVCRRWPQTRFALVSGWGSTIAEEEASARGVDAVLAKPYRLDELRKLVGRAVGNRERQRQVVPAPEPHGSRGRADSPVPST